jgi:hypothetical protein
MYDVARFEPRLEAVRAMSLQTVFHADLVTEEFVETRSTELLKE